MAVDFCRMACVFAFLSPAGRLGAGEMCAEWNFARESDAAAWKVSCETVRQDADGLYLAGDNKTSLEIALPKGLKAVDFRSVELDFTSYEGETGVLLWFRGKDQPFAEPRLFRFPTLCGESRIVRQAGLDKPEWEGEIAALRLMPIPLRSHCQGRGLNMLWDEKRLKKHNGD